MAEEDTIVQDIEIGGADAAAAEFEKVGTAGEASFNKIESAATQANAALAGFATSATESGKKAADGVKQAEQGTQSLSKVAAAAGTFGTALQGAGAAAATFATRVGLMAGAATAAVGGILLLAKSVLSSVDAANAGGQSARQMNVALKAQAQALTDAKIRAVTNARALSELDVQFAQGKLTMEDYVKQMQELRRTQQNEEEDAKKIAKIQNDATQDRLKALAQQQAEQEKRAALNSLVSKFGSDLTSSLLRLGTVSDNFWRQAVQGPSLLARGVDLLTQILQQNGSKIIEFGDRIKNAIVKLFDFKEQSNLAEDLGKKFVAFGEDVVSVFENIIVPAVRKLLDALKVVADALNGLFGTKFTAQSLVAIALVLQLTGGFKLMASLIPVLISGLRLLGVAVTTAFGPWGILIALIIAGLIFLATQIDWGKLVSAASSKIGEVIQFFQDLPQKILTFFESLWNSIKQGFSDAWQWVKDKAQEAWDFIVGLWNSLLEKISGVWQGIKDKASDVWTFLTDGFQSAIDKIVNFFTPLLQKLGLVKSAADKALEAISQIDNSGGIPGVGADGTPFARGGEVHGPGTTTSDSIWARLSRGEFVMKAAAVRRYGLATMHALNQLRARAPAFSMGGLVEGLNASLIPRLASGGAVMQQAGTGRPIVLNIGGESFNLFTRDSDTAEQLGRFATKRRLGSTGRKPSYIGS